MAPGLDQRRAARTLAQPLLKSGYGSYLLKLLQEGTGDRTLLQRNLKRRPTTPATPTPPARRPTALVRAGITPMECRWSYQPSNNYGPWQYPEKLIPVVILKAAMGEPIPLYGDGLNVRDWLYVEDHVEALLLAATHGRLGASYCVGAWGTQ